MRRKAQLLFALCLLLVSSSGCRLDAIGARQDKATMLRDELIAGRTFGQTFLCTQGNLYRIDLGTATYARTNTAPVIFHLQSSPLDSTDILSLTIPGPEVQNERATTITFPPLPDSEGRGFYFYIESPRGEPGNAITVYMNSFDQYSPGTAYLDGEPASGDLVFTAYGQEEYTFYTTLDTFLSRLGEDRPFLVGYGLCLLSTLIVLAFSLFGRR